MSGPRRITSSRDPLKKGWEYRFTDPLTRKQTTRIHWFGSRRDADDAHQAYLENRRGQAIGLPDTSGWQLPYDQLVTKFLDGAPITTDVRREELRRVLERNELGITCAVDFNDLPRLTGAARRLAERPALVEHGKVVSPAGSYNYVIKYVQQGLKQLTRWAAGQARLLPQDPLAAWQLLKAPKKKKVRRAFLPVEMCAVLAAAAEYDALGGAEWSSPIVFKTILVSGNRPSALFNATVADLHEDRIDLPEGNGKKHNGQCTLPPDLILELRRYVERRRAAYVQKYNSDRGFNAQPLLVSARGAKIDRNNMKRFFEKCMSLAFVRLHWPAGVPDASRPENENNPAALEPSEIAYRVATHKLKGFDGPPPKSEDKKIARLNHLQRVEDLAEQIAGIVRDRCKGLYMYRLRHTHVSWARSLGKVSADSVKQQVGHAPRDIEEKFYLDLVDAHASSDAVWSILQTALEAQTKSQPALKIVGGEMHEVVSGVVPGEQTQMRQPQSASAAFSQPTGSKDFKLVEDRGIEPLTSRLPVPNTTFSINGGERSSSVVSFDKTPDQPAAKGASRCLTDATTSIQTSTQSKNPLFSTTPPPSPADSLLTQLDMRLQRLIAQWEDLPEHVRQAIDLMNRKAGE